MPLVSFLLLVPFRLPISVLLIKALNWTATIGSFDLPLSILCGNVMVSKFIYDAVFSVLFIIGCRNLAHKKWSDPGSEAVGGVTCAMVILTGSYLFYDMSSTYELFYFLNK